MRRLFPASRGPPVPDGAGGRVGHDVTSRDYPGLLSLHRPPSTYKHQGIVSNFNYT
jgi:hypothetical protein